MESPRAPGVGVTRASETLGGDDSRNLITLAGSQFNDGSTLCAAPVSRAQLLMSATTRARTEILAFAPRRQNTLAGFAEFRLPSGMILHDVGIHIAGTSAWASLPGKPMLDRNDVVLRDDRGKIKYSNVIAFATKKMRDRFSEAIIEAVRVAYPDVLVPTEGRPA
jgi:hypothetical protein